MHPDPTFDVHIHLAGTGCGDSGCWSHPQLKERYTMRLLRRFQGLSERDLETDFDQRWADRVARLVAASPLRYGVVLGFAGVADPGADFDPHLSQMIIPPSWVFGVCRRYPNLLPGPSVNPYHRDAMAVLEECIEGKAVLIKWLPPAQRIDPADPALDSFYRRVADVGIPLLIHGGGERTFRSLGDSLGDIARLRRPLDAGVTVICAHSGTKILGAREPNRLPLLREMLRQYPNLWVDNSGLANPSRWRWLPQLASDPLIASRTLYGSDWPVPANSFYFLPALGVRKVWELEQMKNPIARDVAIKAAFGFPEETLTRAGGVLSNLGAWIRPSETLVL